MSAAQGREPLTMSAGRHCDGCGKPGGTPVAGRWYLHPRCAGPFRAGVASIEAALEAEHEAHARTLAALEACQRATIALSNHALAGSDYRADLVDRALSVARIALLRAGGNERDLATAVAYAEGLAQARGEREGGER